jgi:N12 class adenine-specific DNA methylase
MMGHRQSTYLDIQSRGVEFLRAIYSKADLTLKPKPTVGEEETLRNMIRALGYEAVKTADGQLILKKTPKAQPLTITADGNSEARSLRELFLEAVKREIRENNQPKHET